MNMTQIRAMAKEKGAKVNGLNKAEAIRAIQLAEGNFDCFGSSASGDCDQEGCMFRGDCLKSSQTH